MVYVKCVLWAMIVSSAVLPRRPVATAAAVAVATMVVCDDAIVNCVDVLEDCLETRMIRLLKE